MKRILVLTTIVLLVAGSVIAGEEPRPREHGELGHYLQLTAEQRAVWDSAHADFMATIEPLAQQRRAMGQQLEATLKSGSADACSIGNQVIAAQAIEKQIRAARETMTQKQLAVLTPEQKTKYDAFIAARPEGEMMRVRLP
jgi:Spy/CpxP family protein refolding chaperone